MRRTLFSRFRGSDGRSLMRALVALLLANAIVAGIHLAPANAATPTICSVAAAGHADGSTTPSNSAGHNPCCAAGCMPAATVTPPPPDVSLPSSGYASVELAPVTVQPRAFTSITPPVRGPPSLA